MQLLINWSSLSFNQHSLSYDHALWRYQPTYACPLTRLSVLNENIINAIRRADTTSRVEILQVEHGLSFSVVACYIFSVVAWLRIQ